MCVAAAVAAAAADVVADVADRTELEARVEIRQPEELEVFNSLRLSVVVLAEILAEILAELLAELLPEVLADVAADVVVGLGYRSQIWLVVPVV